MKEGSGRAHEPEREEWSGDHERLRTWIEDARAGGADGMYALYHRFGPDLRRFARRRMAPALQRWVTPEGLVSRVLCEVLRGLWSLPADNVEEDLRRRLYRVAKCRIADEAQRTRRYVGESVAPSSRVGGRVGGDETGIVTREDARHWMRQLLERLPREQRDLIQLRMYEELSWREIAERLGRREDAVRKRFRVALGSLQRRCGLAS